jgi:uncharacterized integral membrane protein (TIGR00698 family)
MHRHGIMKNVRIAVVVAVALATLLPWVTAAMALLAGIAIALTIGNPSPSKTKAIAAKSLTYSVVALGAEMNLGVVGRVGLHGIGYTAVGVTVALVLGTQIGKRIKVAGDTALLVSVGTAICGGSAIAAVAPAIRAKEEDVSMALVTVFLLNAIALFIFPTIGHHFHLSEDQFGLWAALAIHDTSSVVGAASQYGPHALEVATAAKLARALWIIPVTFGVAAVWKREGSGKPKRPWFIAGFLAVAALVTFVPAVRGVGHVVGFLAHRTLATTLFLIGLGLSRPALKALGARPLVLGVTLWLILGGGTLAAILAGVIR